MTGYMTPEILAGVSTAALAMSFYIGKAMGRSEGKVDGETNVVKRMLEMEVISLYQVEQYKTKLKSFIDEE